MLDEENCYWQLGIKSKIIKKLLFKSRGPYGEFESRINNVIRYAIGCNVEELNLTFYEEDGEDSKSEFLLNEFYFMNACFTDLRLQTFIFNPDAAMSWKRLKTLCISDGYIDEDVIENILSGSPVLETLELEDCYGYRRLNIPSRSVKELVLSQYYDCDGEFQLVDAIEINAPNILSLKIKGYLHLLKLLLSNVSSLVKANLDITKVVLSDQTNFEEEVTHKSFIIRLHHVKELQIGNYYSEDVSKQVMLEKYKAAMIEKYKLESNPECMMMGSMSEEVQLQEKIENLEHEQEAQEEQLKEKIQKMEHEQTK